MIIQVLIYKVVGGSLRDGSHLRPAIHGSVLFPLRSPQQHCSGGVGLSNLWMNNTRWHYIELTMAMHISCDSTTFCQALSIEA